MSEFSEIMKDINLLPEEMRGTESEKERRRGFDVPLHEPEEFKEASPKKPEPLDIFVEKPIEIPLDTSIKPEPEDKKEEERRWHDAPPVLADEEVEIDLIPGIVRGAASLKRWIVIHLIVAFGLVSGFGILYGVFKQLERKTENNISDEREQIGTLEKRISELEYTEGAMRDLSQRAEAVKEQDKIHRDFRPLFDLLEQELLASVTLLQFRADEASVVLIEAYASDLKYATAQARHFQDRLGNLGKVELSDIRITKTDKMPAQVLFRIRLEMGDQFWTNT